MGPGWAGEQVAVGLSTGQNGWAAEVEEATVQGRRQRRRVARREAG